MPYSSWAFLDEKLRYSASALYVPSGLDAPTKHRFTGGGRHSCYAADHPPSLVLVNRSVRGSASSYRYQTCPALQSVPDS